MTFEERMENEYKVLLANDYGGFAIGEGWYDLIEALLSEIKHYYDWRPELDPIKVQQIKEKFGGLRFYYSGGDSYIRGLVTMIERISEQTCEVCGNKGRLNGERWLKTTCSQHEKRRD